MGQVHVKMDRGCAPPGAPVLHKAHRSAQRPDRGRMHTVGSHVQATRAQRSHTGTQRAAAAAVRGAQGRRVGELSGGRRAARRAPAKCCGCARPRPLFRLTWRFLATGAHINSPCGCQQAAQRGQARGEEGGFAVRPRSGAGGLVELDQGALCLVVACWGRPGRQHAAGRHQGAAASGPSRGARDARSVRQQSRGSLARPWIAATGRQARRGRPCACPLPAAARERRPLQCTAPVLHRSQSARPRLPQDGSGAPW